MAAYVKCKWLETAGRRVMPDYNLKCAYPLPEMPDLPVSITNSFRYLPATEANKQRVRKDDCAGCKCFTPKNKDVT